MMKKMEPLIKHFKRFRKVLKLEEVSLLALVRAFFVTAPFWLLANKPEIREWKRRYKVCLKCPIFDKELRRCRPFNGSSRGCGCYVPFSNIFYDECWSRKEYGGDYGWSSSDQEW